MLCFLENDFPLSVSTKDGVSEEEQEGRHSLMEMNTIPMVLQSSTLPFTPLPPAWLLWAFMGPKCTTCSLSLGLSAQAETLAWGLLLPHPALLPWLNAINFPNQARGLSPAWQICQHSSPTHHEISNSLHLCPPGVLQAMSWNVLYVCAGTVGMSASPTPL